MNTKRITEAIQLTLDIIRLWKSNLFDAQYYQERYPDIKGWPLRHFCKKGWKENLRPNKQFIPSLYLGAYPEARKAKMNPLLHYYTRGKKMGYCYTPGVADTAFPAGTAPCTYERDQQAQPKTKRVAIMACYSGDGRIPEYLTYYLKGLQEVADHVILIGDHLIFPQELEKLKGLVTYAHFDRHAGYDFISYKRGWLYAQEKGLLDSADELIICNDSCYGPVHPLSNVFSRMEERPCDFWGLISNAQIRLHIQSYFYVFKRQVFQSTTFEHFMQQIEAQYEARSVIDLYETRFTQRLEEASFTWSTYIPDEIEGFSIQNQGYKVINKTCISRTLMALHGMPLLKVKLLSGELDFVEGEGPQELLSYVETSNPELASIIHTDLKRRGIALEAVKTT